MKNFDQVMWKYDVESFDRWLKLYHISNSDFALQMLKTLQEKWPNHKLGDMPK